MKKLNAIERAFWQGYLETLSVKEQKSLVSAFVEVSHCGNKALTDDLLALYLSGKKTAGSGLVADYKHHGDPLPKVGNFWIILDSKNRPRCILKTVRVEFNAFKNVTQDIARAEGEGDLSLLYWRKAHKQFFTPFLKDLNIKNLEDAQIVTEFYKPVYQR